MARKARYKSVRELVRGVSEAPDFADEFEERLSRRQIVKRLFALRNAKGLSQRDMADRLGCTQSRVSKLENSGDGAWRVDDLIAYAEALGLEPRIILADRAVRVPGGKQGAEK